MNEKRDIGFFFYLSTNEVCAQVGELLPHKSVDLYEAPENFDLFSYSQKERKESFARKVTETKLLFRNLPSSSVVGSSGFLWACFELSSCLFYPHQNQICNFDNSLGFDMEAHCMQTL